MTDNILISSNNLILRKPLWSEEEILIARCMWFDVNIGANTITINMNVTFRRAVFGFLEHAFVAFSTQPQYAVERMELHDAINAYYRMVFEQRKQAMSKSLPWYDKLWAHQKNTIAAASPRKVNFLSLQPRLGKAQPLSSKVLTTSGWKLMQDICVGDEVYDHTGSKVYVTGVYPQGKKEVFKVMMSDGFHARSCKEHLWVVSDLPRRRGSSERWDVMSLNDIAPRVKLSTPLKTRNRYRIPVVPPLEFPESDLPIHPYLLGLIIGDGCIASQSSITFSTNDMELVESIRELLPSSLSIHKAKSENYSWLITLTSKEGNLAGKNPLINALRGVGLWGKGSREKFIPEQYLHSSIEQRTLLLQGLMDTDGYVCKKGRVSFSTTSEALANGLCEIVQSLGGIANIGEDKRDGKHSYFICIILPPSTAPFRLTRRLKRVNPEKRMKHRRIVSVSPDGEEDCQCISVSGNNNTYITDNYIVTHNTISTASISVHNNITRTVVVTYAIGKSNWMYDMTDEKWGARHVLDETNFTILDRTKKRSMDAFEEKFVIINYDSLHNFIRRIVDGGPPIGHIILSECQKIKSHQSNKWKNVYKLVSLCPDARITFESGTPIMNRADDLFSYFRLVGHPLGEKYSDFKRMFLQVTGTGKREKISGTKNIKLLQLCMSNFMIRYTQEECTDIPKHSYVNTYFDLDEWKPHYQEALEHARKAENRKVLESYIHSINRVMAMAKIPGVIEHAESLIDAEEKVVILTLYQDSARKIADHFGDKCVLIDGSVDGTEKVERSRKFKSDPNIMVAVVNMMAAGHTISLASASHGIVLSLPLSPKVLEQATDRLKDITKTKPSTIYYALCRDDEGGVTVDERLMALNSSKDSDIAAVIDNKDSASMQENAIDVLWKDIVEQKDEV